MSDYAATDRAIAAINNAITLLEKEKRALIASIPVCPSCRHAWRLHKDVSGAGRIRGDGTLDTWACVQYAGMGDWCGCERKPNG